VWDTAIMPTTILPCSRDDIPRAVSKISLRQLARETVIVVIHHGFCRDHCIRLIEFMERLNALACPLIWRSLGELVSEVAAKGLIPGCDTDRDVRERTAGRKSV